MILGKVKIIWKSYVLDILFDLLYESDALNLADIHTNRSNDGFQIIGNDGGSFK